jgi:hypothetical protein
LFGTFEAPTPAGLRFTSLIREITGGERPFFLEGMQEQYLANFGFLLIDPGRETPLTKAATNEDILYEIDDALGLSDAKVDAEIRRIPPVPGFRDAGAYPDRVPTTGRIQVPLLTLHNTGDLFVPISHEVEYRAKAEAAGTGDLLVQRAIRAGGHCQFSEEERTAAWEDLVAWVRDGEKPAGDDLSGDLSDIGREFTNPIRPGDPGTK